MTIEGERSAIGEGGGLRDPERLSDDEREGAVAADAGGSVSAPGGGVEADPRYATDRAVAAGYPPDFGPEERVMYVRPAFWRSRLVRVLSLVALPIGAGALVWWLGNSGSAGAWTLGVGAGLWWGWVAGWWCVATGSLGLEITNKRSVEVRGLLSRSRDEVLHDHIRNVTVDQSFYDRVMRIGKVGIASSGQGGTEIEIDAMPSPQKIREVIDLYRPLD